MHGFRIAFPLDRRMHEVGRDVGGDPQPDVAVHPVVFQILHLDIATPVASVQAAEAQPVPEPCELPDPPGRSREGEVPDAGDTLGRDASASVRDPHVTVRAAADGDLGCWEVIAEEGLRSPLPVQLHRGALRVLEELKHSDVEVLRDVGHGEVRHPDDLDWRGILQVHPAGRLGIGDRVHDHLFKLALPLNAPDERARANTRVEGLVASLVRHPGLHACVLLRVGAQSEVLVDQHPDPDSPRVELVELVLDLVRLDRPLWHPRAVHLQEAVRDVRLHHPVPLLDVCQHCREALFFGGVRWQLVADDALEGVLVHLRKLSHRLRRVHRKREALQLLDPLAEPYGELLLEEQR
mmetsp:Transcript_34713/g.82233  ORF Transcript_34713/g.82233 Transcript_34713/m.82233 type:complete len:351 (+) Transcript_34713:210-1262(+)